MKKIITIAVIAAVIAALCGCSRDMNCIATVEETTAVESSAAGEEPATEMKSIRQNPDDPLVGDYRNTADERMVLCVERRGDEYIVSVNLILSDREFRCWTMTGAERDGDRLTYRGEEIGHYTYDAEGNETSSEVTAANNLGYFERKGGKLYWTGAAQEECRGCVFEKIVYSEE